MGRIVNLVVVVKVVKVVTPKRRIRKRHIHIRTTAAILQGGRQRLFRLVLIIPVTICIVGLLKKKNQANERTCCWQVLVCKLTGTYSRSSVLRVGRGKRAHKKDFFEHHARTHRADRACTTPFFHGLLWPMYRPAFIQNKEREPWFVPKNPMSVHPFLSRRERIE